MNLLEVLEVINKNEKIKYTILRDGIYYDIKTLKSFHKDLKELSIKLEGFNLSIKWILSRRRAMIVMLQESFYNKLQYDKNIDLNNFLRKARIRFVISNRNTSNLNTPEEIYSKNPRQFYEDNSYGLRQFIEALELLALDPESYFEVNDAINDFIKRLNDLKE